MLTRISLVAIALGCLSTWVIHFLLIGPATKNPSPGRRVSVPAFRRCYYVAGAAAFSVEGCNL